MKKFAAQLRESQSYGTLSSALSTGHPVSNPNTFTFITTTSNGPSPLSHGGTLYSSAPPSVTNPQASTSSTLHIHSPQNLPASASNSPQKQHKTIPHQQQQLSQGSSTAPAASPTVSSNTNTPHMANTGVKRKQTTDVASPTISNGDQPPAKRPQRKRGRTAGGGG